MADSSTSARRLRWLVLVGLAGVAVWVVRSRRAGPAGLLEQWPDTSGVRPPAPATGSIQPVAVPVRPGTVPARPDVTATDAPAKPEPTPDVVAEPTEPTGQPEPEQAQRLTAPPPDVATPPLGISVPTAADAPDPDASDVPGGSAEEPSTPPAPAVTTGDPEHATDHAPAEPLTGANPLFAPPRPTGAEQAATRPSPSPRPRSTTASRRVVGSGAAPALPDGSAPGPEYTIKGNAGSMLFHRPDSPYYNRTKAEIWFRTATDARAAGFTEYSRNRPKDS